MKKIILGLTAVIAIVLFLGVHTAKAQTSATDTTTAASYTVEARPVSFFERMKLRFIFKQEKKAEILKEFSQRNFELAQKKLSEGKESEATELLKKSDKHLLQATESVSRIRDEAKQQKALDAISAAVSTRTTVLSEVKDKIQNPAAKEAIERAIIRHAEDSDKSEMKIKSRINDLKMKTKDRDNEDNEEEDDVEAKDLSAASASATIKTKSASSSSCGGTSLSTASIAKNTTYPNQTVVPNTTHFKIGSYKVKNNCAESIHLTSLNVGATIVGTTINNFPNAQAYINGVQQGSTHSTIYPFAINYTIPAMQTITVDFYSDIGPATSGSLQTGLWVSGIVPSSGSSYSSNTISGQLITIGASSITATVDASTPAASIVHDNQTVTSAAFKFAAVNSAYNVTDLTLTIPQSGATVIQNVKLYDGSNLIATRPGSTTVTFNGLSWNVPANTNKVLTVKLQLGVVGVGAGTTGAKLLTTLTNFTVVDPNGLSLYGTESNPAGNAMYAYAAIPTITNIALPSTTLSAGIQTISKFSIASSGGNVSWKKLSWTVNRVMSGIDTLSTVTLWDLDSNTQIPGIATFTGSINTDNDIAGGITFVATNEQQLSGSKTYGLKVLAAFTPSSGDYLSASIQQPSTYMSSNTYSNIGGTPTSFVWSDISAVNHNTSTLDWTGSYLVRNLPTSAQTLVVN